MTKSRVSQTIIGLQENMGWTRNEAIKFSCENTTNRFQKNFVPTLTNIQESMRYNAVDLDNLYELGSRWYQGVMKKDASRNIKIQTIIKLATAFEMTPGELLDCVVMFGKKSDNHLL